MNSKTLQDFFIAIYMLLAIFCTSKKYTSVLVIQTKCGKRNCSSEKT